MLANKPKSKILVDGGDPEETLRVKELIGFVDGQTTNPSLSRRARKCSPGFPMPTLNIRARAKACEPQKCRWPDKFA